MLLGKKEEPTVPKAEEVKPNESKGSDEIEISREEMEDSVATDIKKFKKIAKGVFSNVSTNVAPYAAKGAMGSSKALKKAGELVDQNFLKKLVRLFLILLFLAILVFVVINLFKSGGNGNGKDGGNGSEPTPTPTPAAFIPNKPSVYADDPEIKKFMEDIVILEQEISGTNIREPVPYPPTLDFDISFQ